MAIAVMPFYSIVLRVFVEQDISQRGWRTLMLQAALGRFDGEIMALGAMNSMDLEHQIEMLEEFGYKHPRHGDEADFAVFESGIGKMPYWLECVKVNSLDDERIWDAWKLRDSEVYTLHEFTKPTEYPTKGYQIDWPPHIGKILR